MLMLDSLPAMILLNVFSYYLGPADRAGLVSICLDSQIVKSVSNCEIAGPKKEIAGPKGMCIFNDQR